MATLISEIDARRIPIEIRVTGLKRLIFAVRVARVVLSVVGFFTGATFDFRAGDPSEGLGG